MNERLLKAGGEVIEASGIVVEQQANQLSHKKVVSLGRRRRSHCAVDKTVMLTSAPLCGFLNDKSASDSFDKARRAATLAHANVCLAGR